MSLKLQQLAAGETGGGLGVNPSEEEGGVRGAKTGRGGRGHWSDWDAAKSSHPDQRPDPSCSPKPPRG